jgi:hypothetical protein
MTVLYSSLSSLPAETAPMIVEVIHLQPSSPTRFSSCYYSWFQVLSLDPLGFICPKSDYLLCLGMLVLQYAKFLRDDQTMTRLNSYHGLTLMDHVWNVLFHSCFAQCPLRGSWLASVVKHKRGICLREADSIYVNESPFGPSDWIFGLPIST